MFHWINLKKVGFLFPAVLLSLPSYSQNYLQWAQDFDKEAVFNMPKQKTRSIFLIRKHFAHYVMDNIEEIKPATNTVAFEEMNPQGHGG